MEKLQLLISEDAEIQIEYAHFYYKIISKKVGDDFKSELNSCFQSIVLNPTTYKIEFENFRQAVVKKFPFVVIYAQYENVILITSVFNTNQNPDKKFN